jgi:hypothetical protein
MGFAFNPSGSGNIINTVCHRTTQSTALERLLDDPDGADVEANTGGGWKIIPGLTGIIIGGCLMLAVYPNCPAAKLDVPVGFVT